MSVRYIPLTHDHLKRKFDRDHKHKHSLSLFDQNDVRGLTVNRAVSIW